MRTMDGGRFVRVALVLPTEYAYARGVLRGIIASTRARNMYVADARAPRAARGSPEQLPWLFNVFRGIHGHSGRFLSRWFKDWNPDGIIGQIYDDRLARVYRATRKPVVELFESRARSEFPRILPDDVATGELAAQHFLERGFRHFAFFGAPWMLWSRERETGFRAAVERTFRERAEAASDRAGAAANSTITSYGASDTAAFGTSSAKKRATAMGNWLASLPKPVAVFAANDLWGSELVQAARERGLRVPDDVALLGVDNEELLCELAHPPLSSIRLSGAQIGAAAVALLEHLLRGRPPPKQVARIAPTEVVTRQSSDVLAVEDADVADALRYIRRHAYEGLSVKQLLDAVALNRRTLERRFVSVLGHTPLEEIRRVRLERAKALLQTDLPVYDVARRCGFTTPEYLATSFAQATGMTPTEYRKRLAPRGSWERLPPSLAD